MSEIDPEDLEARSLDKKARKKKKPFTSDGPYSVLSLDGHDKMYGYQNWYFPIGVYGCQDTFSRKMLFINVNHSNSNPLKIGKLYLQFLYRNEHIPETIRIDRGSETGKMATIHAFLINRLGVRSDPKASVRYGPSTSNKIERWWKDLHERLEKYFKLQLTTLLNTKEYDPHNALDRQLLAYIYIPMFQRECNTFVDLWNSHRIRAQNNLLLPTGVPNHMFDFPEQYGGCTKGYSLQKNDLREVAEMSGVLSADDSDFFEKDIVEKCKQLLPRPEEIKCNEAMSKYRYLRRNIRL